ncbi:MAG: penicillin-binding transpeptidase domain-containing protein [Bacillota bacterium]
MKKLAALAAILCVLALLGSGCGTKNTGAAACTEFLDALCAGEYAYAYTLLSASVQNDTDEQADKRISSDAFVERYRAILDVLKIDSADYAITAVDEGEILTKIEYTLTYHSMLAGDMTNAFKMEVVREDGRWRIDWSPALIFPSLEWGDTVRVATLSATRGEILSDAVPVAQNVNATSVTVTLSKAADKELLVSSLSTLLGMTEEAVQKRLDAAYNDFVIVKQFYPDELDSFTKEQLLLIDGVGIDQRNFGILRDYSGDTLLAHTLGYVGYANEEDIKRIEESAPDAKGKITTDSIVGKTGLERVYENQLRGTDGKRIFIADPQGALVETLYEQPAENGLDVNLTIDYALQQRVETLLNLVLFGDKMSGAVVVMNPLTGAVEAMASYPTFSLNSFARGISADEYNEITGKANTPLFNRVTQGLYPPGSTFKPFTAAAALESGVLTPDVIFPGHIEDDKWLPTEFGPWSWSYIKRASMNSRTEPLNMHNAIINSDNIYFAYSALMTGKDLFVKNAERLGMSEAIPFELYVAPSQIYNKDADYNLMLLADSGFGQGQMLSTPLQLAAMFSAFANGGDIPVPYVVEGLYRAEGTEYTNVQKTESSIWKEDVISRPIIQTLEPMLEHVVSKDYNGTGHKLGVNSCTVAGKTGTAEIGDDKTREISWFVGFRVGEEGTSDPRLVLVMLEVPVGDKYSALKFDIARELLKMPPKEET